MDKVGQVSLMINLEKSKFLCSKVLYLGFELSADGLRPGRKKVKAVEEFPIPHDMKAVHRFLGLDNDLYGAAMKHYLATKGWPSDPKI